MFDFFKKLFPGSVDTLQTEEIAPPTVVESGGGAEDLEARKERVESVKQKAREFTARRRSYFPDHDVIDREERIYEPKDGERQGTRVIRLVREKGWETIIVKDEPDTVSVFTFAPDVLPVKMVLPMDKEQLQPAAITSGAIQVDGGEIKTAEELWKHYESTHKSIS